MTSPSMPPKRLALGKMYVLLLADETELTEVNVDGMVLNNAEITGTVVQAVTNAGIKGAEISLIGREGNGSSSTFRMRVEPIACLG